MINFKKVTFKNFMSFGATPTEVQLDGSGKTLILGQNLDVGRDGESRNGCGKCLGKDTPILMHDRTIKMVQDVEVGDLLMGDDGTPRTVLSTGTGREELFRVKQNLGMDYTVNRSHILSLRVGTDRPAHGLVKGEIVDMPVEDYLALPPTVKKSVCGYIADLTEYGETKEDLFSPWMLGLWLADGTTSKPDITYNDLDVELHEEVEAIRESYGFGRDVCPSADRENRTTVSYPGGFLRVLKELGVLGDKHIPSKYLEASYSDRLELLAGFLDGDGYTEDGKHTFEMTLKKNRLVDDLVFLARSLGFRTTVTEKFAKCPGFDGEVYMRIHLTGELEKIPNRLPRKKKHPKAASCKPRSYGSTGIQLESLGEGDYYGFEIDGNRRFCLGDMTVTHNTTFIQAIVFAIYGKGIDKLKADEFINLRNMKKLEVSIEFEKDGVEYKIIRGRKPNKVIFLVDEKDVTRDSMKNTDEAIQEIIGIPYEIFVRSVFTSPHIESFMALSMTEQRYIMESLLSLNTLVERADTLKNVIRKEIQDDLRLIENDLNRTVESNQKLESAKEKAEADAQLFDTKKKQFIEEKTAEMDRLKELAADESLVKKKEEAKSLRDENNNLMAEFKAVQKDLTHEQEKIVTLVDRFESLTKRKNLFEKNKKAEIADIETELAGFLEVEEYQKVLDTMDEFESTIKDLDRKIELQQREIPINEKEINRTDAEISDLVAERDALDAGKCVTCGQRHTDEEKLEKIKRDIELKEANLGELVDQINAMERDIKKLEDERDAAVTQYEENLKGFDETTDPAKKIRQREKLEMTLESRKNDENPYISDFEALEQEHDWDAMDAKIDAVSNELKQIDVDIEDITMRQNDILLQLKEMESVPSMAEFNEIANKISYLEEQVSQKEQEVNPYHDMIDTYQESIVNVDELQEKKDELEKSLTHVNYLIKLLTDPKSFIRRNIINAYLPLLNKKLVEYSEIAGLPHVAELNPDMTVSIEYMGQEVSYYMMSRGERLRLNTATMLAFRDLMSALGVGCNLMLVDELIDGSSDTSGVNSIFGLLMDAADDLFIVSHREEFKDLVDRVMVVTKENGFSDLEIHGG